MIVLIVIVLVLCLSCASDNKCDQVVLYCSVDQNIAEPIIKRFEEITGIKVLARFDTESGKTVGLVQRLRAEASAPACDVFWSSEIFYTIRLAGEGIFAPYKSKRTSCWPAAYTDADSLWYGFALRKRCIAYNTDRVTKQEVPTSLEDLLDKRWYGRIVMARPEFGTTGGDLASWRVHYGADKFKSILRGLSANKIRLVSANSTAVRSVAMAQADVCMTDTDDVYAAKLNKWHVNMVFLDQNHQGALAIPNTAALIKNAPHEKQARRLMEFLLSDDVEQMLFNSDSHNMPLRSSAKGNLDIDYKRIADELTDAVQEAREILE